MPATTFSEHIQEIVGDFLQTAVLVDDRAFGGSTSYSSDTTGEKGTPALPETRERGVTELQPPANVLGPHDLDSKAVTDAFAARGLVCSLIAPDEGEDIDGPLIQTARRADLVVLDWVLNRDETGETVLELLTKILQDDDQAPRRRLRVVAVYTGQDDLPHICDRVRETIDAVYPDYALHVEDDGYVMTKGPVRAAVFAKEQASLPSAASSNLCAL